MSEKLYPFPLTKTEPVCLEMSWLGCTKLLDAKIRQCCIRKPYQLIANSVFALDPEWHESRLPIDVHLPIPQGDLYALLEPWARSVNKA